MAKVLIIHGSGMNMRGKFQLETFGAMTLPEYDEHIRKYASELGLEVEIFHSNIVGCPMDQIHVGLPVQVRFVVQKAGRLTLPVFTPVSGHDDDRRAGA